MDSCTLGRVQVFLGPVAWERVGHPGTLILRVNLASQSPIHVSEALQVKTLQTSCG